MGQLTGGRRRARCAAAVWRINGYLGFADEMCADQRLLWRWRAQGQRQQGLQGRRHRHGGDDGGLGVSGARKLVITFDLVLCG